MKDGLEPGLMM